MTVTVPVAGRFKVTTNEAAPAVASTTGLVMAITGVPLGRLLAMTVAIATLFPITALTGADRLNRKADFGGDVRASMSGTSTV